MSLLFEPQKKRDVVVTTDVVVAEPTDRDAALIEQHLVDAAAAAVVTSLTAAAKAAEKNVAAFGESLTKLSASIVESASSLSELMALVELDEGVWVDEAKHPRWPAGTPGGLGGQFMKVGQRFSWHGAQWDVAAVLPGHIWAHLATHGIKNLPQTIEINADQLEGGHPVISGVTRPPAEAIVGQLGPKHKDYTNPQTEAKKMTGTVVDPYVDTSSHDPSIPIPPQSPFTEDEWARFGKLDQERYSQVMELNGEWKAGAAQTKVDAKLAKADAGAKALLLKAHSDSGGNLSASTGLTLSLYGAYGTVQGKAAGSPAVEKARTEFEAARALQDDVAGVLQWDLYNRLHSPDISIFHRNYTLGLFENEVINGDLPVFSGLSQSQEWAHDHNTGFGDNTFATPMAIRLIVMARIAADIYKTSSFKYEKEVATADSYIADHRSLTWSANGLSPSQQKWLTGQTNGGTPGATLEALKESFADAGVSLPVPPAKPVLVMDGEAGLTYIEPPKDATVGASKLDYADKDADGVPVAKPAKELDLSPGDYVEGMKGTRYIIVNDPSTPLGLGYFKVTDMGTPVGPKKPYAGEIHDQNTGNQAYTGHTDWQGSPEEYAFGGSEPGLLPFKKLAGHFDLPAEAEGFTSDFHPEAWSFSAKTAAKPLLKFEDGQILQLQGSFYKVVGQLGGNWTRVQSLSTGKLGKLNSDYQSTFLVLKEGYSESGQVELHPDDFFKGDVTTLEQSLGQMTPGQVFQVGQTMWKVESAKPDGQVEASQASGASKNIGKLHTFEPAQKVTLLVAKPLGWEPPQVGDTLAVHGKKATVTKILANGDVQLNLAPGVLKVKPGDPLLAGVYSPAKWDVGSKAKLKQIPEGSLFHGGTGAKVKPYLVVAQKGKLVTVQNLDTGEQSDVSWNKSYVQLTPKIDSSVAPTLVFDPPVTVPTPDDLTDVFDPEKWEAGPHKYLADLIPGDVVVLSGKPYKVDAFTGPGEDQAELKNLTTGEVFAFSKHGATLSGLTSMPTLQAKGLGEQIEQTTATPVAPTPAVLPPAKLPAAQWDHVSFNPDEWSMWAPPVPADTLVNMTEGLTGTVLKEKNDWYVVTAHHPGQSIDVKKLDGVGAGSYGHLVWSQNLSVMTKTPAPSPLVKDYTPISGYPAIKPESANPGELLLSSAKAAVWKVTSHEAGETYADLVATVDGKDSIIGTPIGGNAKLVPSADMTLVTQTAPAGPNPALPDTYEWLDDKPDVLPSDVPVGTLLGVHSADGDFIWKKTGATKSGKTPVILVATPDGSAAAGTGTGGHGTIPIGGKHSLGEFQFVHVEPYMGAPPAAPAPDFAPVFATAFDPSLYKEVPPAAGYTLGDIEPGLIWKGKSGAYFQMKKVSGANVYATNLSTGKATKVEAKTKPAMMVMKPDTPAYADLKPGSPAQLGQLEPGDQYFAGDQLMQVLEKAPSVAPDDQMAQVKAAPVFDSGSLGAPQLAGNSPSKLVSFKAFKKDVPPAVPTQELPAPLDIDALPSLSSGESPGAGLIVPYKWHKSGQVKYPKLMEMPAGAVFHDAKQQHFKIVSSSSYSMAVVSAEDGKTYKVDGNLRGRFVPPADVPLEAKDVFKKAPVQEPDTVPGQVQAKLVAPKLKANTDGLHMSMLGLGAGDWVKGADGLTDGVAYKVDEAGGVVADKPTWWHVTDGEGHAHTLGMTAQPDMYWKASDLLEPVQAPVQTTATPVGAPPGGYDIQGQMPVGELTTDDVFMKPLGSAFGSTGTVLKVAATDDDGVWVQDAFDPSAAPPIHMATSDWAGTNVMLLKAHAPAAATPAEPDPLAGYVKTGTKAYLDQINVDEIFQGGNGHVFKLTKVEFGGDPGVWVQDLTMGGEPVKIDQAVAKNHSVAAFPILEPAVPFTNKVTGDALEFESLAGFTHNPDGDVGELSAGAYFTAPNAVPGGSHTVWQVMAAADEFGNVPIKVVWAPSSPGAVGKDSSVKKTQAIGYSAAAELPPQSDLADLKGFTQNELGVTVGMLKPGDQFSDGPGQWVYEFVASDTPFSMATKAVWPPEAAGKASVAEGETVPAWIKQAEVPSPPAPEGPSVWPDDYTPGEPTLMQNLKPGDIFQSMAGSVFQMEADGKSAKNLKTGGVIHELLKTMPVTPLTPKATATPTAADLGGGPPLTPNIANQTFLELGLGVGDKVNNFDGTGTVTKVYGTPGTDGHVYDVQNDETGKTSTFGVEGKPNGYLKLSGPAEWPTEVHGFKVGAKVMSVSPGAVEHGTVTGFGVSSDSIGVHWDTGGDLSYKPEQLKLVSEGPVVHDQDGNVIEPDDTVVALDGKSHEVASISPTGGVVFKEGGAVYPNTVKVTKKGSAGALKPTGTQPARTIGIGGQFTAEHGPTFPDQTWQVDSIDGDLVWAHDVETGQKQPFGVDAPVTKVADSSGIDFAGKTGFVPTDGTPLSDMPVGSYYTVGTDYGVWQSTGPAVGGKIPQKLVWSADASVIGQTGTVPDTYVPPFSHPPDQEDTAPPGWFSNHAGFEVGQWVNVVSPGGSWSHVPVVAVTADNAKVKLPGIAEAQIIPNAWLHADPLVFGKLGGHPMSAKEGDIVTYLPGGLKTGPGPDGDSDPVKVQQVGNDALQVKFSSGDSAPFSVPKGHVFKIVQTAASDGGLTEPAATVATHGVQVGDIVEPPTPPGEPGPGGTAELPHWEVIGQDSATTTLKLVKQALKADGKPIAHAVKLGDTNTVANDQLPNWKLIQVGTPKVSDEKQAVFDLSPGKLMFLEDVKGVPSGTYQKLPAGAHTLFADVDPLPEDLDADEVTWVRNLTDGKVYWLGSELQVKPMGNVTPPVKVDFDPADYADAGPATTMWALDKTPGRVLMIGNDHFMIDRADDDGGASVLQLTGSDAGKMKTFGPDENVIGQSKELAEPYPGYDANAAAGAPPDLPPTKDWEDFVLGDEAWTLGGKHGVFMSPESGPAQYEKAFMIDGDPVPHQFTGPLYVSDPLAEPVPIQAHELKVGDKIALHGETIVGAPMPGETTHYQVVDVYPFPQGEGKPDKIEFTVKNLAEPTLMTTVQKPKDFEMEYEGNPKFAVTPKEWQAFKENPPGKKVPAGSLGVGAQFVHAGNTHTVTGKKGSTVHTVTKTPAGGDFEATFKATDMVTVRPTGAAGVPAEATVGSVPKGSIVTLSGGKKLVVGATVTDKMDGSTQVQLLDPESWPDLYTVAPPSEAVGSVKEHGVEGYKWHKSGNKSYPHVGTLPIGARFHGKDKKEWEVAETPKYGMVKAWHTSLEAGGTVLSTVYLPEDLRVFQTT